MKNLLVITRRIHKLATTKSSTASGNRLLRRNLVSSGGNSAGYSSSSAVFTKSPTSTSDDIHNNTNTNSSNNSKRHASSSLPTFTMPRPRNLRLGWGNEVLNEMIPFTSELTVSKGRAYEQIAVCYCNQSAFPSPEKALEKRTVADSWLEIVFPFSDHPSLRDYFLHNNANSIRYGKLFEMLDALAGDVAYRHCGSIGSKSPFTIVTASVDGVRSYASIDMNVDLRLQAYITYVGKSSMEVQ